MQDQNPDNTLGGVGTIKKPASELTSEGGVVAEAEKVVGETWKAPETGAPVDVNASGLAGGSASGEVQDQPGEDPNALVQPVVRPASGDTSNTDTWDQAHSQRAESIALAQSPTAEDKKGGFISGIKNVASNFLKVSYTDSAAKPTAATDMLGQPIQSEPPAIASPETPDATAGTSVETLSSNASNTDTLEGRDTAASGLSSSSADTGEIPPAPPTVPPISFDGSPTGSSVDTAITGSLGAASEGSGTAASTVPASPETSLVEPLAVQPETPTAPETPVGSVPPNADLAATTVAPGSVASEVTSMQGSGLSLTPDADANSETGDSDNDNEPPDRTLTPDAIRSDTKVIPTHPALRVTPEAQARAELPRPEVGLSGSLTSPDAVTSTTQNTANTLTNIVSPTTTTLAGSEGLAPSGIDALTAAPRVDGQEESVADALAPAPDPLAALVPDSKTPDTSTPITVEPPHTEGKSANTGAVLDAAGTALPRPEVGLSGSIVSQDSTISTTQSTTETMSNIGGPTTSAVAGTENAGVPDMIGAKPEGTLAERVDNLGNEDPMSPDAVPTVPTPSPDDSSRFTIQPGSASVPASPAPFGEAAATSVSGISPDQLGNTGGNTGIQSEAGSAPVQTLTGGLAGSSEQQGSDSNDILPENVSSLPGADGPAITNPALPPEGVPGISQFPGSQTETVGQPAAVQPNLQVVPNSTEVNNVLQFPPQPAVAAAPETLTSLSQSTGTQNETLPGNVTELQTSQPLAPTGTDGTNTG